MKVMCIDTGTTINMNREIIKDQRLALGKIYHPMYTEEIFGFLMYALEEFGSSKLFSVQLFAPLSSIDETELIKERQLETA